MKNIRLICKILIIFFIINIPLISQWKRIENIPSTYTNNFWLDVYFLESNPQYGWISGANGYVLRTTDAGITWLGSQVRRTLIDTIDLGNGFRYDTTFINMLSGLESIHFVDEMTGYTVGKHSGKNIDWIYKSTDGGNSWFTPQKDSMNVWGLFFITKDVGLAVGGGCNDSLEFHRTEDGGYSWKTFKTRPLQTGLTDVILIEEKGLGYAVSSGYIWITNDGGSTWNIFSQTGNIDWQEELTKRGNTFIVPYDNGCSGSIQGGNFGGGLRTSTNNGLNWNQFDTGKPMFGAFLIDSLRGWGCGVNQSVYFTSDGGQIWELKNCGIESSANLDDMWFVDDSTGWVVGNGIYKTVDADTDTVQALIISSKLVVCEGDSLKLECGKDFKYYRWSTGDTTKSIYVKKAGHYILVAYDDPCQYQIPDSVSVGIYTKTNVIINSNRQLEICEGDSVLLWVENKNLGVLWSTDETTDTIIVKLPGTYYVTIIDTNGCNYSNSVDVYLMPFPKALIDVTDVLSLCDGDSVILKSVDVSTFYLWYENSNPDIVLSNADSLVVFKSGRYALIVTNEYGCSDTSSIVDINFKDFIKNIRITTNEQGNYFDFDTINIGNMLCKKLILANLSPESRLIDNIYIVSNIEYSIPNTQLPFILEAGDSIELNVCFRPIRLGMCRDTILLSDECGSDSLPLFGVGSENQYYSETDCNVGLIFQTDTLLNIENVKNGKPYPNPAGGYFYILLSLNIDNYNQKPSAVLNNLYGEDLYLSDEDIIISTDEDLKTYKLKFITQKFFNGYNMITIRYGSQILRFPVIVNK